MNNLPYIPNHVWDIIFQYDGRIKYLYKKGIFVNIIHTNDIRYEIVKTFLTKKIKRMEKIELLRRGKEEEFYIEIPFETVENMGLVFDYHWSYPNQFEICYYHWKNDDIIQTRSYVI